MGGRILEACDRVLGDGLNACSTQDAFVRGRHATAIPGTETQETFGGNAFLCNSGVHLSFETRPSEGEANFRGGGRHLTLASSPDQKYAALHFA